MVSIIGRRPVNWSCSPKQTKVNIKGGSKSPIREDAYYYFDTATRKRQTQTQLERQQPQKVLDMQQQVHQRFRELHVNELVVEENSRLNMKRALDALSTKKLQYSWQQQSESNTPSSRTLTTNSKDQITQTLEAMAELDRQTQKSYD